MSDTNASQDLSKPTARFFDPDVKRSPEVREISELDFKRFVPTGITLKINTPLVKNNRSGLFGVNIDGFIPTYTFPSQCYGAIYKNMFPVQAMRTQLDNVSITQEQIMIPAMFNYYSYRYMSGNIGLGVRIASNTGQSGNLIVSQITGAQRRFYSNAESYQGLQFHNATHNPTDYGQGGFSLIDLSLNRTFSITPIKRDPLVKTDLALLLWKLHDRTVPVSEEDLQKDAIFTSQFLQDWLVFGALEDLPNQNSNQIVLTFFFDFSQVNFYTPLLPVIPSPPAAYARQILKFSDSFNNNVNANKGTVSWLP